MWHTLLKIDDLAQGDHASGGLDIANHFIRYRNRAVVPLVKGPLHILGKVYQPVGQFVALRFASEF
jgi:hypothetical protein